MPQDTTIVRAEIHPAIGLARVGNSQNEWFPAPETPDPVKQPASFYRDGAGAIKRQAVRFRVYGYNAAGQVVAELTDDNAKVEWTVHVANKKAAWYQFTLAMDLASTSTLSTANRRNPTFTGSDRKQLVIDPGARSIQGKNQQGPSFRFDTGKCFGETVYLGELQTDSAGRLLFLGGKGVSHSPGGHKLTDFANNDFWYDDVSDGPVRAKVKVAGVEIPVAAAWAIVGPPNYAPQLKSVRTLYDLLDDLRTPSSSPLGAVSFQRHIRPIFERLAGLQWVNAGFAAAFGWKGNFDFVNHEVLAALARLPPPGDALAAFAHRERRFQILNQFRDYADATRNASRSLWPWIYGDTMDVPGSPQRDLALSRLQLGRLRKWALGEFVSDYDPVAQLPSNLDQVDLSLRPALLTEAALTFAVADAFHPGCEVTWGIRTPQLYEDLSRIRLKQRASTDPEPDFGAQLTPQEAMSANGPLSRSGPGDLTRWMALPWQTDSASCRSGYERYTPATPTFWPARVPNQVLGSSDFQEVMNQSLSAEQRLSAFGRRADWFRALGETESEYLPAMVQRFGDQGIVGPVAGPNDLPLPREILVESLPPNLSGAPPTSEAAASPADRAAVATTDARASKVNRFAPLT